MREGHLVAGGPHSLLVVWNLLTSCKDIDALKDRKSVTFHKIYSVYVSSLRRVFGSMVVNSPSESDVSPPSVAGVYLVLNLLEVAILQSHTQNRSLKGFFMGFPDYFQKSAQVLLQHV